MDCGRFHTKTGDYQFGKLCRPAENRGGGINDDSLFIDYVDHGWCWRAESKGFVNGITPKIKLAHYVGPTGVPDLQPACYHFIFYNIIRYGIIYGYFGIAMCQSNGKSIMELN